MTAEPRLPPPPELPAGEVCVTDAGLGRLAQHLRMGRHLALADEPTSAGGGDQGPNPYDYLLAALGACTSMTLRMYAEMKQLPLERVQVRLRHRRIHAQDCAECATREGKVDEIERRIELVGPLDESQRQRLLQIAERCPVHRTLQSEIRIVTALQPAAGAST